MYTQEYIIILVIIYIVLIYLPFFSNLQLKKTRVFFFHKKLTNQSFLSAPGEPRLYVNAQHARALWESPEKHR